MIDKNRVLLLQAPVPGPHNRVVAKPSAIPPLGLGYLASVIIGDGFEARIVDMDMEDMDVAGLEGLLGSFLPGIVGISTATLTLRNGLRVAKVVKRALPRSIVCLGGPHVSVRPEDALRYPFVDVVVQGEGELTFLEVCRAAADGGLPVPGPAGTVQSRDGGLIHGPRRERISDLDILPFPARHLMVLEKYNIPGTILTSRGCPFACGFCAGPTVLGRKYTARSAAGVVAEVQTCVDLFGLTSFYFVDDTITHDTGRLLEICEGLRGIRIPASLDRELKWTCESRADVVSPEILAEMRRSGCTTIQFGMESGSQRLLDRLGKRVTVTQIAQAVEWARRAGISPVLSMVFPHPDETEDTLRETFAFVRRLYDLGAEKIIPSLLTLFPGTRFMDQREELGLTLLTEDIEEYNLGTPMLTTRHMDLRAIANGYTQLLMLTQLLGGTEIGGIALDRYEDADGADRDAHGGVPRANC